MQPGCGLFHIREVAFHREALTSDIFHAAFHMTLFITAIAITKTMAKMIVPTQF
jgi:hypothetical protein